MKLKITDEIRASMAETKARLDENMKDPGFKAEIDLIKAQYAARDLVESALRSAWRRVDAFKKNYHMDFVVSVTLDDEMFRPVMLSSREMALS